MLYFVKFIRTNGTLLCLSTEGSSSVLTLLYTLEYIQESLCSDPGLAILSVFVVFLSRILGWYLWPFCPYLFQFFMGSDLPAVKMPLKQVPYEI